MRIVYHICAVLKVLVFSSPFLCGDGKSQNKKGREMPTKREEGKEGVGLYLTLCLLWLTPVQNFQSLSYTTALVRGVCVSIVFTRVAKR